jgi:superfamily I DNA/RNA helicase
VAELSDQQQAIVDAPLKSMAVVACAGSGKTKTAVQRLFMIREELDQSRSHVALLSFSNIAVDTFREAYSDRSNSSSTSTSKNRVTIDTFDGFITSNILRPHAYRTMGCKRSPFLLTGSEPFLLNNKFKYWYESSPTTRRSVEGSGINDIVVNFDNDDVNFNYRVGDKKYVTNNGFKVTQLLGSLGAYTHELGKYWSLYTLIEQPEILRVLAKRYPHIIVDEAQDLGELHQKILELMIEQGVKVTLIGDPNQAIYEFAGATGDFINVFNGEPENKSFDLSLNYRSIPEILNVANAISGRTDKANNKSTNADHGAYYAAYEANNHSQLVELFDNKLKKSGLSTDNSAVLYRGNSGVEKLQAKSEDIGQGKIKLLVLAAIQRDSNSDFQKAFKLVASCVVGLLVNTPENLATMIISPGRYPEVRDIRQDIWIFIRSVDEGLPSAKLRGSTVWHGLVKTRLVNLLDKIEKKYGYTKTDNIGRKLSKIGLVDKPLIPDLEVDVGKRLTIRVDTVHQVKGESLDAVLYMASKPHINAMLDGVNTEIGRIGYVAITRAKNLFILGVPKNALAALAPKLQAIGLNEL